MESKKHIEVFFWSIAFPGFGQLLNGKYGKGLIFLILEILINNKSNLNTIIIASFNGKIETAIQQTNYQWLMFYPCVYLFAIWDAYKDAGGGKAPYSFLPFVFSAFFGTIGVVFSFETSILPFRWGPVWLSIFFFIFGVVIGWIIKRIVLKFPSGI